MGFPRERKQSIQWHRNVRGCHVQGPLLRGAWRTEIGDMQETIQKVGVKEVCRAPSLYLLQERGLIMGICAHFGVQEGYLSKALAFPPNPPVSLVPSCCNISFSNKKHLSILYYRFLV